MMADILPFKRETPIEGPAFCLQCDHAWIAKAPVGKTQLECPNCHTLKGLWKLPFAPCPETLVRTCDCGNQLFFITEIGRFCINCGVVCDEG